MFAPTAVAANIRAAAKVCAHCACLDYFQQEVTHHVRLAQVDSTLRTMVLRPAPHVKPVSFPPGGQLPALHAWQDNTRVPALRYACFAPQAL